MKCIVCKQETDKFNKVFQAGFCAGEWCVQQLTYAWGSLDNALNFYRMLYVREDGTVSDTPLNWFPSPPPPATMYTHVEAARYKK